EDVPSEAHTIWATLEPFIVRDEFGNLAFRNALLRDSAYNGLSFRVRRQLHSRAGDTLAHVATETGDDLAGLLSFHYLHAQRSEEAWAYALHAAEKAKDVYANVEAAEYFERAIVASRRLPDLEPVAVAATHEDLGDARNLTGDYAAAAHAYRAARRLTDDDPVSHAR